MKQTHLLIAGLLALIALSFINQPGPTPSLLGRWQKRSPDGSVGMGVFRADSSHSSFVNGKQFTSGTYYVRLDTLHIQDVACGAYYGTYKLTFVTSDSIHLAAIQDRCQGRRQGYNGLTLGRIKPAKP